MADWPFALLFLFLFAGALARGQGTYWLARLAAGYGVRLAAARAASRGEEAGRSARLEAWLEGKQIDRGRRILDRWGALAVAGCYLTVGLQSVVIAAAGAMRMRWPIFALAQAVGALAWAAIYSTVGFAAWSAVLLAGAESPVGVAIIAALALGAAVWIMVARRRARSRREVEAGERAERDAQDERGRAGDDAASPVDLAR